MLTVADALRLDVFAGAEVVAGTDGLQRTVAWIHNVGVPDAHNWVNGGELVLTTAINMPDAPDERQQYLHALADKGVAGLAVAVGRYIETIPDYLCAVADQRNLPLIAIPFQSRFVDVARAVNERISQENLALFRRVMTINQVLSRLVLDGGGLQDLANTLADLIGQSISIETERFEALASANIAEIDEARRYTLDHGRTNPLLVKTLEQRGYLSQIRDTLRPVQLPRLPDVGLEMERILAPVVVHGDIYGYMWIIADGSPLSEIDNMALESGATVAALMMLHQEAVQSAEASLKGSLFSKLIQGETERASVLTDEALRYGLDLEQPYRLVLLEAHGHNGRLARLYHRVNGLVLDRGWPAVVGQFAGQVLVLVAASSDIADLTHDLHTHLDIGRLRFGVSGLQTGPNGVATAYGACKEVLDITQRLGQSDSAVYFDDLGYLHTLFRAGAASLQGNPYLEPLSRLNDETHTDLFHTLEAYLDTGGNGVGTAERLHIHRSTLNYRLQRIAEVLNMDSHLLSDPAVRVNLQVSLKLFRLFKA